MENEITIANRILAETIAEMPEYLSKQSVEDIWEGEFCAECHIVQLFYKKLLEVWPARFYHSSEELKQDFLKIADEKVEVEKKDCWELHHQGCILALKHRHWCIMDNWDTDGKLYVGYTDLIGVGWPMVCLISQDFSVEAIRILDDMTEEVIESIQKVMPLLKELSEL